jgi:hypothetical protein
MPNNFDNNATSAQVQLAVIEQHPLSFYSSINCFIEGLFIPFS